MRNMLAKLVLVTASLAVMTIASPANAAAAPALRVLMNGPDHVSPGGLVGFTLTVQNVGDETFSGDLALAYTLPASVQVKAPDTEWYFHQPPQCEPAVGQVVQCVANDVTDVAPGGEVKYRTFTTVDPGASGVLTGEIRVSGGGAPDAVTVPIAWDTAPIGPFAITDFNIAMSDGASVPGSTPAEMTTAFSLLSSATANYGVPFTPAPAPPEAFRRVVVHAPAGFVGNPTATGTRCSGGDLARLAKGIGASSSVPLCPVDSQIGYIRVNRGDIMPLYNVEPRAGSPATFGFNYLSSVNFLVAKLRPSDHGVDLVTERSPNVIPITNVEVALWGSPTDSSHDLMRGYCIQGGAGARGPSCPAPGPRIPFLRTPTSCSGQPLAWLMEMDTYEQPGNFRPAVTSTPTLSRCDLNPFDPVLSVQPSTSKASSPTGVGVTLDMPQDNSLTGRAEADLRHATVTMPEGLTINPSSADGLAACSDSELHIADDVPSSCGDASKLGSVSVVTPLLDHPIPGSVFLRTQNSDDPQSGELFRIVVELRSDDDGIDIKLPGAVKVHPGTGRLTTVFDNLPQLPFKSMQLKFKDGPRAPLATPSTCGSKTVTSNMTSWNERTVGSDSTFTIDGDGRCGARGFAPALRAGVDDVTAARSGATFSLKVTRTDQDQEIASIATTMPKGLLAQIGDVPVGAQIGTVKVGAGVGTNPFYLDSGKVYLTGPYKGAPYGLDIQVPAVAGPFNLGIVDVKAKLDVDPVTAQAVVTSDPMPRFVKGVPVLARDIRVTIDRPGFMVNPTSCAEQNITAAIGSFDGATATPSQRFQAAGCNDLALAPKLAIALTGKGQTTDGKHPGVQATLTQPAGQSNLKKVSVQLPLSLALDTDNANGLCEFVDGSKVEPTCPKASIVGTATARTPLLGQPLSGPVYFVKNVRIDKKSGRQIKTLPKLVIPLTGQNGLRLNLTGTSDVVDDHLVTTFDNIPDAPVTSFKLNITGGKRGILAVSGDKADICKSTQIADQQIDGQNGKFVQADLALQTPACPLKVLSKKTTKTSVAVKVGGLGAGKVTVTGRGIRRATRTIASSTVATITAKRVKGGKPGKVTVSFDPTGPAKVHETTK